MKNSIYNLLVALILLICTNCTGLYKENVINRYYLIDMDYEKESRSLSYELEDGSFIGLVDGMVFAVGNNENFIIVKQHPRMFPDPPNKAITHYFIIQVIKKGSLSPEKLVVGPMNLDQFNKKRHDLAISDEVTFNKVMDL